MQIMPEKTNSEAPFPQQSRGFHGGKDVDIEGVTGSIPVTPTIRTFPEKTPASLLESNVMFDARHSRGVSAPTGRFST